MSTDFDAVVAGSKSWYAKTFPTTITGGATTGLRPQADSDTYKVRLYETTSHVKIFNPSTTETLYIASFNNDLEWTTGLPLTSFFPILPQTYFEYTLDVRANSNGDRSFFAVNTGVSSFDYNVFLLQRSTFTRVSSL